MTNTFIVSDTHFGHWGVTKFLRKDGEPLRPWDNIYDMDEALIQNWNNTVGPKDKVYHLGDFVINRRALKVGERLNGDKILIKGNHDIFRLNEYSQYFRDIRAYHVMTGLGIFFSHVPIHESQLERFGTNVHGHLHSNRVMKDDQIDPRYLCVCVEHTDFKPIALDDVKTRILAQGGTLSMRQGNY